MARGNTRVSYTHLSDIVIDWSDNWFIPASMLAELRRKGIEKLLEVRRINYRQEIYLSLIHI